MVLASPGVNILEKDQLGFSSAPVSNPYAAAFISTFKKGPLNTPQYIRHERELNRIFGEPPNASQEDYLTLVEYLNYGGGAYVTRIASEENKNAQLSTHKAPQLYENTSEILAELRKYPTDTGTSDNGSVDVIARSTGSWANNLGLVLYDSGPQYVAHAISADDEVMDVHGLTSNDSEGINELNTPGNFTITLNTAMSNDGSRDSGTIITLDVWDLNKIGGGKYIWIYGKDRLTEHFKREDDHKKTFYVENTSGDYVKLIIEEAGTKLNDQKIPLSGTQLKYSDIGSFPTTTYSNQRKNILNDEINYAIIDLNRDEIVERGLGLSKLQDSIDLNQRSNYYVDVINNNSEYIYIANPKTGNNHGYEYQPKELFSDSVYKFVGADLEENTFYDVGNDMNITFIDPINGDPLNEQPTNLMRQPTKAKPIYLASLTSRIVGGRIIKGGVSNYNYGEKEINTGYGSLDDTINFPFNFIITGSAVPVSASSSEDSRLLTITKVNRAIELAESRTDAIVFASPIPELIADSTEKTTNNIINYFGNIKRSSYVFFDSGVKSLRNRFSRRNATVPCNGDMAGICRRNIINNNSYTSPAGVNRGVFAKILPQLLYNPTQAERDRLYTNNINPIVVQRGAPPTLYGDRTGLLGNSPFSDLSVRLFFIDLKNFINQLSVNVLFEKNTPDTREQFSIKVNKYLSDVYSNEGIGGYSMTADESNNPREVVDRGEFVADIFIRPLRSINVINVNLVASDVQTTISEITGSEE